MNLELILLPKGTVRWIEFLATRVKPKAALGRQCAYAEMVDTPNGSVLVKRCNNQAVIKGYIHGWLCKAHLEAEVANAPKPVVPKRDTDQEVIESILATESRAIKRLRGEK